MKSNIQKQITKLNKKKEELDNEINSLKLQLNSEESEWIAIPETDFEVTKNVLFKGKTYEEIMNLKKPDEDLLDLELIGKILKNPELVKELKMDGKYSTTDDFFFKQPFETNKEKGYVARFYSSSYRSVFYCIEGSDVSYSGLGCRFVRKREKLKNIVRRSKNEGQKNN